MMDHTDHLRSMRVNDILLFARLEGEAVQLMVIALMGMMR
jgi:hypothetical protein